MSTGMTTKALLGGARERIHLDVQPMDHNKTEIIEKWLQAKGTHGTTQNPLTFRIGDTGLLLSFWFALDSVRKNAALEHQIGNLSPENMPSSCHHFRVLGFLLDGLSMFVCQFCPDNSKHKHRINITTQYSSDTSITINLLLVCGFNRFQKKYLSIWSSPQTLPTKTNKTTN